MWRANQPSAVACVPHEAALAPPLARRGSCCGSPSHLRAAGCASALCFPLASASVPMLPQGRDEVAVTGRERRRSVALRCGAPDASRSCHCARRDLGRRARGRQRGTAARREGNGRRGEDFRVQAAREFAQACRLTCAPRAGEQCGECCRRRASLPMCRRECRAAAVPVPPHRNSRPLLWRRAKAGRGSNVSDRHRGGGGASCAALRRCWPAARSAARLCRAARQASAAALS
jgi:hypothetical protein